MKTIRSKIFLGVLFLFIIITVLSVIAIVFVNQLAQSSRGTIVDNYRTINYTTAMLSALDEMYLSQSKTDSSSTSSFIFAKKKFEENLSHEAANITEPGESELVSQLQSVYKGFIDIELNKAHGPNSAAFNQSYSDLKASVIAIYQLNMTAISNKNAAAENKAQKVTVYTLVIGGFSIILTLFFILTFPARIVKPIKELTSKIKAISHKDYNQQLNIHSNDELGQLANAFNSMAVRLKEFESQHIGEILTGKQRLEALVQNMQDGILVLDTKNQIVLANQVLADLSGISIRELLNKNISEVSVKNDLLRSFVAGLFETEKEPSGDKKTISHIRDNKEYYYELEIIPILTNSDNPDISQNMGNMIILKNITRYEERDVAKTNLISTVSHEMKTPISSINLTVKLLEDSRIGNLNSEQKELIQAIRQQSNRLSKVVNEILNYSQIETGNIRLNFSIVHPENIVDYATTALMIILSEKNIQLETEIEKDLPTLSIDVEKTVWILVNLISNAIRYSPKGGKIIISAGKDKNRGYFSVKDFGSGIAPEDQKKLFSRFTQVGERSQRGWGLGLAISREFVQAQGGTIKVESNENEGSEFTFYLPINFS